MFFKNEETNRKIILPHKKISGKVVSRIIILYFFTRMLKIDKRNYVTFMLFKIKNPCF